MLPRHHLPQLVPQRINATLNRLQALIWIGHQPLAVEVTASGPEQISLEEAQRKPRRRAVAASSWGKLFDQRWCRIQLPAVKDPVWLNWQDQGEATLYAGGKAFFGFDVAHRYCRLPAGKKEVWLESNCIQSAIWHPDATGLREGSFFKGAWLCRRDEKAWTAYHDLKCLLDVALDLRQRENPHLGAALTGGLQVPVEKASPAYRRMLRLMDEAVDALDTGGLESFSAKIKAAYGQLRSDKSFMCCVLTGHAHIDLVWLWPERMGELKAVHTFATVNRLMDDYPDFRFAYSQSASYEAVNRRNPVLYREMQRRIRQGKWEAGGAMYVESDTLMPCGEALTRSFILGQKGFTNINGRSSKLAWLPDVFGYSACLPQIMKQMGVDFFFTTKLTWNTINRFPYSSFIWKGNDGSEVLAHLTQECGYNNQVAVSEVKAAMYGHHQGHVHDEYLMPSGFGDGGGGPTAEMCEQARRLSDLPGMPSVKWDQPEAFFERLSRLRDQLPLYQGECYLETHRGTFSTHANLKESFRGLECALHLAEAVCSTTGRSWNLEHEWKRMVFAQFHDYIPGSSVWDVYLEGVPELQRLASGLQDKAREMLSGKKKPALCLFNPHAMEMRRWCQHPQTKEPVYVSLPPLSGRSLEKSLVEDVPEPVQVRKNSVSNGLVEFRVNASGWIDSLVFEGKKTQLSGPLGQLVIYPDRAAHCEAWDIDRHVLDLGKICDGRAKISSFREGKHRAGFKVTRDIGKQSRAVVSYALTSGSHLLEIELELDWKEPEHLAKLLLPTRYAATNARFGAPFGSVLRSQVSDGMTAEAMWEVPFSRYLAVFDEGEKDGLFLVTQSKYGAYVKEGEIGLTLVRSPRIPGFDNMPSAWPAKLSRLKIPGPYSDLDQHTIRLALGSYDLDLPRERQPAALAETHFSDPLDYAGNEFNSPLLSLDGGSTLVPVWAKPLPQGDWILRLHEVGGRRGTFAVDAAPGWKICRTGLSETGQKSVRAGESIPFLPYQIVSLRFSKQARIKDAATNKS